MVFGKKKVKRRILAAESSVRRGIGLAMELELGSDIEVGLNNIRTDLTELLVGKKLGYKIKKGKHIDVLLENLEETAKGLERAIEKKDAKRIKVQIGLMRTRIGDLRTEFRR